MFEYLPYRDWKWVLEMLGSNNYDVQGETSPEKECWWWLTFQHPSGAWAEVIIRVKWRLKIQTNVVMLWSALLLVNVRIITMIGYKDGEWWLDWWWTNSLSQDLFHPGDQIPSKYVTAGFKPLFFILSSSNVVMVSFVSLVVSLWQG